jgi:hypothetical protein
VYFFAIFHAPGEDDSININPSPRLSVVTPLFGMGGRRSGMTSPAGSYVGASQSPSPTTMGIDNVSGEWEREGMRGGLEERLEVLLGLRGVGMTLVR